jgi:hypothetical protein
MTKTRIALVAVLTVVAVGFPTAAAFAGTTWT